MPNKRTKIEQAAAEMGLAISSLTHSSPVATGMGDGVGGWLIKTDKGDVNGVDADSLIEEMGCRFGAEPNGTTARPFLHSAEAEGFQGRGLR